MECDEKATGTRPNEKRTRLGRGFDLPHCCGHYDRRQSAHRDFAQIESFPLGAQSEWVYRVQRQRNRPICPLHCDD